MNSREIFILAVKIWGAYVLYSAVCAFFEGFQVARGLSRPADSTGGYWISWGAAYTIMGIYLIRVGSHLVNWAYPERNVSDSTRMNEDKKT